MITGVVGVAIWTDNMDDMLAFYKESLGLMPHSERPHFVSFKWGGVSLGLGTHSDVSGETREPHRVMVNLGVDDIHDEHNRLVSEGVEFTRPPEKEHWGGWVATFHDPDGNTVQLMQLSG